MPSLIWSKAQIAELIAKAKACGIARAECETPEDARSFRHAIYKYRESTGEGRDLTFTLEGASVLVNLAHVPKVEIS